MARRNLKIKGKIIENFGTQEDFAVVVGRRPDVVSRVVNGRYELKDHEKDRWARLLRCEASEIFA